MFYVHLQRFSHQISPAWLTLYTARLLEHTPKSETLSFYRRSNQKDAEYWDAYKDNKIQTK